MGGTAWEIARELLSPPVLNSAPESSELESMAFVLPPVISGADSILIGIVYRNTELLTKFCFSRLALSARGE